VTPQSLLDGEGGLNGKTNSYDIRFCSSI
jgi:hypothetical protein